MGDGRSAAWGVRARSFGSVAVEYAVRSPAYPPEVVPFLSGGGGGRRCSTWARVPVC